jgi:tetratricopeptide (TPR) repeat protein
LSFNRSLFSLLVAFSTTASLLAVDLPREKERWTRLSVDGFTVISNAGDADTMKVANNLQQMRAAMSKVSKLRVDSPLETKIFIFKSDGSFAPYREALMGKGAKNVAGVFLSHRDGNYIAVNGQAEERSGGVVTHELTHYFLNNTVPAAPLWFNEGFAEFYSTFEASGQKVKLGMPIVGHVEWLRQFQIFPFEQMFAITATSKDYNEGLRQGSFYAQSWALVHYLMLGAPERKAQLGTFLDLITAGKPTEAAFREAFGADYATLQKELQVYVRRNTMPGLTYSLDELQVKPVPKPEVISYSETLFQLGDLLEHSSARNFADAEQFLEAAIAADKGNAAALADLAFLDEVEGRDKEAAAGFAAATAAGGDRYLPYLLAGEHALRRAQKHGASVTAGELREARELFARAVQLNPSMPRAYAGLGSTYLLDENVVPGIAALEKSWSLAPSQMDVAFELAVLYARHGDRAKAMKIVDTILVKSEDPDTPQQAREMILQADLQRADKLAREGKHDEAMALVKGVHDETTNPELKRRLAESMGEKAAFDSRNSEIEQYNNAIKQAQARNFDAAYATVTKLIATGKEKDIVDAAKEMKEKLQPLITKKK